MDGERGPSSKASATDAAPTNSRGLKRVRYKNIDIDNPKVLKQKDFHHTYSKEKMVNAIAECGISIDDDYRNLNRVDVEKRLKRALKEYHAQRTQRNAHSVTVQEGTVVPSQPIRPLSSLGVSAKAPQSNGAETASTGISGSHETPLNMRNATGVTDVEVEGAGLIPICPTDESIWSPAFLHLTDFGEIWSSFVLELERYTVCNQVEDAIHTFQRDLHSAEFDAEAEAVFERILREIDKTSQDFRDLIGRYRSDDSEGTPHSELWDQFHQRVAANMRENKAEFEAVKQSVEEYPAEADLVIQANGGMHVAGTSFFDEVAPKTPQIVEDVAIQGEPNLQNSDENNDPRPIDPARYRLLFTTFSELRLDMAVRLSQPSQSTVARTLDDILNQGLDLIVRGVQGREDVPAPRALIDRITNDIDEAIMDYKRNYNAT